MKKKYLKKKISNIKNQNEKYQIILKKIKNYFHRSFHMKINRGK